MRHRRERDSSVRPAWFAGRRGVREGGGMRCRVSVGLWAPSTHAGHAFGRQVWHLGIYKDKKSLLPVEYYNKLPKRVTVNTVYVLDPMPISGATAVAAIDILKVRGRGGDGGVTARAPRPFAGWSLHLRSLPAPRSPSPHIPHHPTSRTTCTMGIVCVRSPPSRPPRLTHHPRRRRGVATSRRNFKSSSSASSLRKACASQPPMHTPEPQPIHPMAELLWPTHARAHGR